MAFESGSGLFANLAQQMASLRGRGGGGGGPAVGGGPDWGPIRFAEATLKLKQAQRAFRMERKYGKKIQDMAMQEAEMKNRLTQTKLDQASFELEQARVGVARSEAARETQSELVGSWSKVFAGTQRGEDTATAQAEFIERVTKAAPEAVSGALPLLKNLFEITTMPEMQALEIQRVMSGITARGTEQPPDPADLSTITSTVKALQDTIPDTSSITQQFDDRLSRINNERASLGMKLNTVRATADLAQVDIATGNISSSNIAVWAKELQERGNQLTEPARREAQNVLSRLTSMLGETRALETARNREIADNQLERGLASDVVLSLSRTPGRAKGDPGLLMESRQVLQEMLPQMKQILSVVRSNPEFGFVMSNPDLPPEVVRGHISTLQQQVEVEPIFQNATFSDAARRYVRSALEQELRTRAVLATEQQAAEAAKDVGTTEEEKRANLLGGLPQRPRLR